MADRRLVLPARQSFVAVKLAEHHEQPPYFRRMECLNLEGADPAPRFAPPALSPGEFPDPGGEATLVDVRGVTAFQGAHLFGSLSIPVEMLSAFAGWLLDPDRDLVLVADDADQALAASVHLSRIGYDRVVGFLAAPFPAAAVRGVAFRGISAVDVDEVARRVESRSGSWTLLDVRDLGEVAEGIVEGARHVYVGRLPEHLEDLDRSRSYTVMCASGARATIAASVLLRAGFGDVDVFLGSMGAWKGAGHPVVKPDGTD